MRCRAPIRVPALTPDRARTAALARTRPGAYPDAGAAGWPGGAVTPTGLGAWVSPGDPADPGRVYAWPDARDLTDAHGWTDMPGQGGPQR